MPASDTMSNPSTTLLTTGEVVERLAHRGVDVTRMTVQRWARTGKVPAKRLQTGGTRSRFLFLPADIDALIADIESTEKASA